MDALAVILISLAACLVLLGALYRLTDTGQWPDWLAFLGKSAWVVGAMLAGVVAGRGLRGEVKENGDKDNDGPPQEDYTHQARHEEGETKQAVEDEKQPTDDELTEDFEELAK